MGQTLSICLREEKDSEEKGVEGQGKGLHFYRF